MQPYNLLSAVLDSKVLVGIPNIFWPAHLLKLLQPSTLLLTRKQKMVYKIAIYFGWPLKFITSVKNSCLLTSRSSLIKDLGWTTDISLGHSSCLGLTPQLGCSSIRSDQSSPEFPCVQEKPCLSWYPHRMRQDCLSSIHQDGVSRGDKTQVFPTLLSPRTVLCCISLYNPFIWKCCAV